MQEITIKYTVYSYDELSEQSKNKAMSDLIEFYVEMGIDEDRFKEAINKVDELETPWFLGQYIHEYYKDSLISELKDEGEAFLSNGKLFNQTVLAGKVQYS